MTDDQWIAGTFAALVAMLLALAAWQRSKRRRRGRVVAMLGSGAFAADVCRALGLHPEQCAGFEIRVYPDEVVTVVSSHFVSPAAGQQVLRELRHYHVFASDREGPDGEPITEEG